jgi:hypothetical protein
MGVCAGQSDVALGLSHVSASSCASQHPIFHASDQFQGRLRVPNWNDHRTCYSLVSFGTSKLAKA